MNKPKARVESVDVLRGLFAAAIMVYHSLTWTELVHADWGTRLLHFVGIYGVEAFFIISGFSMAYVYGGKDFKKRSTWADFGLKRFARIWPLYVCATLVATTFRLVQKSDHGLDPANLALNATLLFGFVDPARSSIVGGWSIGVEMVMYALFPLLVLARQAGRAPFVITVGALAGLSAWMTSRLDPALPLADQWSAYVHVANHAVLFALGMAVVDITSARTSQTSAKPWLGTVLATALLVALALLFGGTETAVVTGWARLLLVASSLALVIAVVPVPVGPGPLGKAGTRLGALSYAVYLLHPFVFNGLRLVAKGLPAMALVGATWLLTLVLAQAVYTYLEMPAQNWIRRLGTARSAP
ncbi:MAG: acyltransferase [Fimbriimonadaceae bacterium]|nr:acyltransferase [Fimbriimonadaceae bacterium]